MRRDFATRLRACAVAALLAPGAAQGATPPPPAPGSAAIAQYREQLPTAGGPVVADGTSANGAPLPPAIAEQLRTEGGADRRLLEEVATSPAYGAPRPTPNVRAAPRGSRAFAPVPPSSHDRMLSAVATELGSHDRRQLVLAAILVLLTAAGVAARMTSTATGRATG